MAETNVMELLQRKVGPAPTWVWLLGVTALAGGYMVIKKNKASVAGQPANPSGSGTGGQFQSSQSKTTTDAQGNTTTTQYSATGQSPFGVPGYLTQQAYPMPYSLGDIYNNISTQVPVTLPATTNNTTVNLPPQQIPVTPPPPPQVVTAPAPPPPPAPAQSPVPDWARPGATWTVDPGNSLWYIASRVLEARLGRPPSNGEIAGYWPAIYSANRGVIGGNPDLIHPGQNFVLP